MKSESLCYECDNTFKKVFKLQNHTYIYIFSTNSIIKIYLQVIKTPQVWSLFRLSFSCENNIIYPWETIFRSKLNGGATNDFYQNLACVTARLLDVEDTVKGKDIVMQPLSWVLSPLNENHNQSTKTSPKAQRTNVSERVTERLKTRQRLDLSPIKIILYKPQCSVTTPPRLPVGCIG